MTGARSNSAYTTSLIHITSWNIGGFILSKAFYAVASLSFSMPSPIGTAHKHFRPLGSEGLFKRTRVLNGLKTLVKNANMFLACNHLSAFMSLTPFFIFAFQVFLSSLSSSKTEDPLITPLLLFLNNPTYY